MGMDLSPSLLWISLTLTLLYFLATVAKKNSSSSDIRLPPGPAWLPILGSLLEVGDQPHRSFARLAKTHGPVMALKLGLTATVVVSSPAATCEVLQKKDWPLSARWVPDTARVFGLEQMSMEEFRQNRLEEEKVLVRAEEVAAVVGRVVGGGGKEVEAVARKAREYGEAAGKAVEEGGATYELEVKRKEGRKEE